MVTVYVYILDTLADWELGYVTSELHSGRFFKKGAPQLSLKTVGNAKDPIHTMGGLTVVRRLLAVRAAGGAGWPE